MDITIHIEADALATALEKIANALGGERATQAVAQKPETFGISEADLIPEHILAEPEPVNAPEPEPVVEVAKEYTLEQISQAGAYLIEEGKMDALINLTAKYGVQSIVQLDKSQYGAFARDMVALGAKL